MGSSEALRLSFTALQLNLADESETIVTTQPWIASRQHERQISGGYAEVLESYLMSSVVLSGTR